MRQPCIEKQTLSTSIQERNFKRLMRLINANAAANKQEEIIYQFAVTCLSYML